MFFSSRRQHTRYWRDWSSDVCSSDLESLLDRLKRAFGLVPVAVGAEDEGTRAAGEKLALAAYNEPPIVRKAPPRGEQDRKSVGEGKSVDLGGRRIIKKKNSWSSSLSP